MMPMPMNKKSECFDTFKSFIRAYGLVEHHVRSYDSMFVSSLFSLVQNFSGERGTLHRGGGMGVHPTRFRVELPWLERVSDDVARIRGTVIVDSSDVESTTYMIPDVFICTFPIMAGSKLADRMKCVPGCPTGSFLVKSADGTHSTPKVILMHERPAPNFIKFKIHQTTLDKSSDRFTFASAEVSSFNGNRRHPVSVSIGVHPDTFSFLKNSRLRMLDQVVTGNARKLGISVCMGIKKLPKFVNLAVIVAACWKMENEEDVDEDEDGVLILEEFLAEHARTFAHELVPTFNVARSLLAPSPFTCKNALTYLRGLYKKEKDSGDGEDDGDDDDDEEKDGDTLESSMRDALPHLSKESSVAKYIAYMAARLLSELAAPRDHTAFLVGKDFTESKRYDSAGELLEELLRKSLYAANRVLHEKLKSTKRNTRVEDVQSKVQAAFVDTDELFWNAIRTGRWYSGIPRRAGRGTGGTGNEKWIDGYGAGASAPRCGVCQSLPGDNPVAAISLQRRIISPLANAATLSRIDEPRMIDPRSIGKICDSETPDGSDVGLKKNLALSGTLSIRVDRVHEAFCNFARANSPVAPPGHAHGHSHTRVFVDGDMIAVWGFDSKDTAECFRAYRSSVASAFWMAAPCVQVKPKEVHVWTDSGRLVMPVIKADRPLAAASCDWTTLVESGQAFLCDAAEEESIRLDWGGSSSGDFDYFVPYPRGILGVPASLIPFANHNQAPRLQFSSSMMKQAIVPSGLLNPLSTPRKYGLDFCQRPLVESMSSKFLQEGMSFTGANAQVAVLIDPSGYAQEDALVYNRSTIQRGHLSATIRHVFEDEVRIDTEQHQLHDMNKPGLGGRSTQRVGQIKVGDVVTPNACQVAPLRGRVVQIERVTVSSEDKIIQKTHVSASVVPRVGDKFTSRHGQKGVIAYIESPENLPFDEENGMVPDLIINPHAFPSRMTEGQHIEGVMAMSAAMRGAIAIEGEFDSSPKSVVEHLVKEGFVDGGRRVLRCGRTGKRLPVKVLIAPVYYNRLTHLVENKARVRGMGGRVDPLTQQPARGRKSGGGLKMGEMEVHAILAQGANDVLEDRLYGTSSFVATVEKSTGSFLYDTVPPREFAKDTLDPGPAVNHVRMPYSTKLLFQEMEALGIHPVINPINQ